MIEKVFGKIIDNPKITLNGILGLTIVLTLFIPKLAIDFSIEHLFSQNDPAVEEYFSFRNDFGREDNVITIIYEPIDHYDINLFKELENIFFDLEVSSIGLLFIFFILCLFKPLISWATSPIVLYI